MAALGRRGVLATLEGDGQPYASVVELIADEDGSIVMFLSDLAAHTRNLASDPRASVVIAEKGADEGVLARSRATFQGNVERVEGGRERYGDAWVEVHPGAANYLGFSDFGFYRFVVEKVRFIAGFGRMGWVTRDAYANAAPDPLREMAPDIIEHMNEDHAHNLVDYVHAYSDKEWAESARMISLDRLGFEVEASDGERAETLRLTFETPRETRDAIHEVMVRLAREARSLLDS